MAHRRTGTIPGVVAKDGNYPWSFFNAITPGYFEALGIPIKAGRDLSWRDWGGSRKVCLVNEALAKEYFGGTNPVGCMMAKGTHRTQLTANLRGFGHFDVTSHRFPDSAG